MVFFIFKDKVIFVIGNDCIFKEESFSNTAPKMCVCTITVKTRARNLRLCRNRAEKEEFFCCWKYQNACIP